LLVPKYGAIALQHADREHFVNHWSLSYD
jgi:hypothetical protein